MPTQKKPAIITIKVTNGNEGEYVKVTNFTSGGTIRGKLNSNKEVILEPSESNLTWNENDSISVEMYGRITNSSLKTISKGGASVTLTASADTTTPMVNL